MERPRYRVVITDCDHGSVDEEKQEFGGKSNAQNGKVIFSPHVSFYSEQSIRELKRRTAKNVVDVLKGRKPHSVVNREVMSKTPASISSD